ncbi:hypothetical protein TTHERM_00449660 (macronuclear) [Tetrahymena thermophila SB210]|uniref:P-loop containing nucleoside triphosphate hydrolase n=1 Tax=Tetrahymena thermophila (strain SB210) TaxID=312017 RepID=Q238V4_TETTS|nr:hypothetical protein TTHERM_00449660 [Tetrahymena thermophila SB210]EAR93116.4 hypothetical protein TTHERM_00449660 [Tetrahymena thermophila SB210]|eukprot:XP_001013361.4 hypothetical protein TTHERM_00449660 [Tetrahymena thermophila SB210]
MQIKSYFQYQFFQIFQQLLVIKDKLFKFDFYNKINNKKLLKKGILLIITEPQQQIFQIQMNYYSQTSQSNRYINTSTSKREQIYGNYCGIQKFTQEQNQKSNFNNNRFNNYNEQLQQQPYRQIISQNQKNEINSNINVKQIKLIEDTDKQQQQSQASKINQLEEKIKSLQTQYSSQISQKDEQLNKVNQQLSQQKENFKNLKSQYDDLVSDNNKQTELLNKQMNESQKQQKDQIQQLEQQNQNLQQQIYNQQFLQEQYINKNTNQEKKIQDMEKQQMNQYQKQKELESKIQKQQQELTAIMSQKQNKFEAAENEINKQNVKIQELQLQNESLERKIKEFQKQQQELTQQIKEKENKISQLINQQNGIQHQNIDLKEKNEKLMEYKVEIDLQNKYVPHKDIYQSGYDMIIHMNSILDLQNKELDAQNQIQNNSNIKYESVSVQSINDNNQFENNLIIVGMQGQRNQGKTFLLNSLINENFPSEFNVNTPGICLKYHSFKGKNIIYVDSEGINGPAQIDYENNLSYQNFIKSQENNEQDDKNLQQINKYVINKHQYKKITEQMQQEFVTSSSHILIIVLTNITQEDVNLIHSIQSYLRKEKNSAQKKIFVMHNMKDFRSEKCVEEYIQKLKTLFPLRQQQIITFETTKYKFNSVFIDTIYKNVNHLFMAYQKSQAGDIYNKFALDYLKEQIAQYNSSIKFNVVDKFKDYLNKNIQNYLILETDEQKTFKKNDIEFLEFNQEQKIIQLKANYKIVGPRESQMDIFGFMQKEFSYQIIKNERKLYLLVDIPGHVDITRIFTKSERSLTLKIKPKEQEEQIQGQTIISTRKKCDEIIQNFKIWGKDKLFNLSKNECKDLKNGTYLFVFIEEENGEEED